MDKKEKKESDSNNACEKDKNAQTEQPSEESNDTSIGLPNIDLKKFMGCGG